MKCYEILENMIKYYKNIKNYKTFIYLQKIINYLFTIYYKIFILKYYKIL